MSFTLALVGRPNVGKSTLFNRLVGRRLALVDDQPGVTRDLREGEARLGPLRFTVLDTAGLEDARGESLQARMRALTERAIDMADACLFMVDARAGVSAADKALAEILRRKGARVILAANKAEGRAGEAGYLEAFELGLGAPLMLSAEHGEGMDELYRALEPLVAEAEARREAPETDIAIDADAEEDEGTDDRLAPSAERPLQLAVAGRPNAGKSTLVNALLGEERLLTGPEAGITRDAISVRLDWKGLPVRIWDTAGLRKRAKVQDKLEKLSVGDALRAVRFSEVVIVLLDAQAPFETQDLRIADLAAREGRAVVIAVNKWDLVENRQEKLRELREQCDRLLPQLRGVELVTLSARTGQGLDRLREAVLRAHAAWNRRVPTAKLNRWLEGMVAAHPPPAPHGRRIKMRYMTQPRTRPPTFVVMCSLPEEVPESYTRYLVNGLREDFDMPGTPIRLFLRSQADKNPFRNKRKRQGTKLDKHLRKSPAPARGRKG